MSSQTEVVIICDECGKKRPNRFKDWSSWLPNPGQKKLDFCSTACIRKYFSPGGNEHKGDTVSVEIK